MPVMDWTPYDSFFELLANEQYPWWDDASTLPDLRSAISRNLPTLEEGVVQDLIKSLENDVGTDENNVLVKLKAVMETWISPGGGFQKKIDGRWHWADARDSDQWDPVSGQETTDRNVQDSEQSTVRRYDFALNRVWSPTAINPTSGKPGVWIAATDRPRPDRDIRVKKDKTGTETITPKMIEDAPQPPKVRYYDSTLTRAWNQAAGEYLPSSDLGPRVGVDKRYNIEKAEYEDITAGMLPGAPPSIAPPPLPRTQGTAPAPAQDAPTALPDEPRPPHPWWWNSAKDREYMRFCTSDPSKHNADWMKPLDDEYPLKFKDTDFQYVVPETGRDAARPGIGGKYLRIGRTLLKIDTPSLPPVKLGEPYHQSLQASGGEKPYEWSIKGVLPPGLDLEPKTGTLSGTPAATSDSAGPAKPDSAKFTVTLTDAGNPAQTATRLFAMHIPKAPAKSAPKAKAGTSGASRFFRFGKGSTTKKK